MVSKDNDNNDNSSIVMENMKRSKINVKIMSLVFNL